MPEISHVKGEAEFDNAKKSAKVVLIDFTATWCGPCRMLAPILEQLSTEYPTSDVRVFKVDVDQNNALAQKYRISAVPAVGVFKNGQMQGPLVVGLRQKADYKKIIDDLLK